MLVNIFAGQNVLVKVKQCRCVFRHLTMDKKAPVRVYVRDVVKWMDKGWGLRDAVGKVAREEGVKENTCCGPRTRRG